MLQRMILGLAGALTLALPGLVAAAPATAAPAVIQAEGCGPGQPSSDFTITDVYDTCRECEAEGRKGINSGHWSAYRCRRIIATYLLYTRV